jgi:hypothetical protein
MASPSTGGSSLDVPLVFGDDPLVAPNETDDSNTSGSSTNKKRAFVLVATTMASLLLLGSYHARAPMAEFTFVLHRESKATYGVDVSWPIHCQITERNEYRLPKDRFAKGSRREAYVNHLQGCRDYYSQISREAARTCDAYEYDRLVMNKRQPQSMEVSVHSQLWMYARGDKKNGPVSDSALLMLFLKLNCRTTRKSDSKRLGRRRV